MWFKRRFLGKGLLVLVAIAILGTVIMLLWNAIVPTLFDGAHAITYWRALGLLVLSRILFGGFRGHGHRHHHRHWRRWRAMSPEEREQICRGVPRDTFGDDFE